MAAKMMIISFESKNEMRFYGFLGINTRKLSQISNFLWQSLDILLNIYNFAHVIIDV